MAAFFHSYTRRGIIQEQVKQIKLNTVTLLQLNTSLCDMNIGPVPVFFAAGVS